MKPFDIKKVLTLLVPLVVLALIIAIAAFSQTTPDIAQAERAAALKELISSIKGVAEESARIYKTKEGYLRFIGAPPSTYFPVKPAMRGTPEEAADTFLELWQNLFVNVSAAVGFDARRIKTVDNRTYVRYRQIYAGLEVFGAEVIIQVNPACGIDAVMSDIMRDTGVLDTGEVLLNPTLDALTAQGIAIEWHIVQKGEQFVAPPIYMPTGLGGKERLEKWEKLLR